MFGTGRRDAGMSGRSQIQAGGGGRSVLEVRDLRVCFRGRRGLFRRGGAVTAVDGVSLEIKRGQSYGLVGESGCGKSTLARSIVGLVDVESGQIRFEGIDVPAGGKRGWQKLRQEVGMVFQDPYGSLNPRMKVGQIVAEPLQLSGLREGREVWEEVGRLLEAVGLSREYGGRYPHELSGGQCQRVAIARAVSRRPKLVICDEAVRSLDVSSRAGVLNLLKDLQQSWGVSYLFIAHDLGSVSFFCDEVGVMYGGRIVEQGSSEQVFQRPLHPYTQELIAASSGRGGGFGQSQAGRAGRADMGGDGCVLRRWCRWAGRQCERERPELVEVCEDKGHLVACWRINRC